MARSRLEPVLIALTLLPAACNGRLDHRAGSSITLDLPPARPAVPGPGFSLQSPDRPAQPGDERASQAVHALAVTRS